MNITKSQWCCLYSRAIGKLDRKMVEAGGATSGQLNELLVAEQDWNRAAIFTDTKDIISAKNCEILQDELE